MSTAKFVYIGTVVRGWGIKGDLKTQSVSPESSSLFVAQEILIGSSPKEAKVYQIVQVRRHGKFLLLRVKGIETLTDADLLRGKEVFVERNFLPETKRGEYYYCDLEGLKVYQAERCLGVLKEVLNFGGPDIYVVHGDERELLIPATEQFIKKIDLEAGRIEVELLEGME